MASRERRRIVEAAYELLERNTKAEDLATRELLWLFDEAAAATEQRIEALFARFADQNGLDAAKARQLLTGDEFSRWRFSMREYMALGETNHKTLLELNTLAMRSRITREEQLLSEIYRELASFTNTGNDLLAGHLEQALRSNYYRGIYNAQRTAGIGFRVAGLDGELVRSILNYPWATKTFSEALWGRTDLLCANLKRELTLGFTQGTSVQEMARSIRHRFDVTRYEAERLVRTESKFFAHRGEILGYEKNGVEEYDVIGGAESGDHCDCALIAASGPYRVDQAQAQINLPPFHPNCLCIIVARFRVAMFDRQPGAKHISHSIAYNEWAAQFANQ